MGRQSRLNMAPCCKLDISLGGLKVVAHYCPRIVYTGFQNEIADIG